METVTKTTSKRRKTFGQQERYEHVTKARHHNRGILAGQKGEAYHRKAYVPDLPQTAQRNIP